MKLTGPEWRCLEIINGLLLAKQTVTISRVAKEAGYGKSAAQRHMDALREKGVLKGPRVVGVWGLTAAGERAYEKHLTAD